ncbi:MAG: 50S ribosomal protein P1 [Candidatus Thermoplasmatota archaeon]|jgi:large subunit ribosomal protein L12|nr:50S ribosomal protein P1 [Candidatus Thermoplasmatota archaeon]MCL5988413.1 50S ribosomal protein P1 [Candidatus Thermoplasmatota archaeon]
MEYVYGALLLHAAGKEIDEDKLKKLLSEAGVSPDEARLKALVSSLKEVNIEDVIKNASVAAVAAAPAKTESAPKKEEPKAEEKQEANDEDAMAGLSSLFG